MGYWEPLGGIHAAARSARGTGSLHSREELGEFLVDWLARRVGLAASRIDRGRSFADHGLDSMTAVELAKVLSDKLGRQLDETLLWNFATIDALLDHLFPSAASREPREPVVPSQAPTAAEAALSSVERDLDEEIARLELELKRR
jgi:acyl carrier protein